MTQEETNRTFDINFAELYDVRPGETDFTGAIDRSLKQGIKHLSGEFIVKTAELLIERQNNMKYNYDDEEKRQTSSGISH